MASTDVILKDYYGPGRDRRLRAEQVVPGFGGEVLRERGNLVWVLSNQVAADGAALAYSMWD